MFFALVTNKNKLLYFAYPKHVVHRRDPKRAFRNNPFNCFIVSVGRARRTNTVRATVDIDTFHLILFAARVSLAPPFRQLFTKRVEPNGFLSSDWRKVVVNLRLI